jgi:uncharacterized membrane protein YhaH (DUF805 family)
MIASYAVMTAATVRRLHDLGQHAGWLQLLPLLGVAGLSLCDRLAVDWLKSALIALSVAAASGLAAVLACRKGTEGENQFGPDPLAAIGPLEESGP